MLTKIKNAVKWRYNVYFSEYIDLFGSPMFYLKNKTHNHWYMRNPSVIYIYANKRNVGDYISFKGVRQLIGIAGPECFCTPLWSKNLTAVIKKAKKRNPNCMLIIGGGGLLQPVFEEFWLEILTSNLPFVTLGIGINKMKGRSEISESLLKRIANSAKFLSVRDEYTNKRLLELSNRQVHLGVCPSVNFVNKNFWTGAAKDDGILLHVIHPSDVRLSGADLDKIKHNIKLIAAENNLRYLESDNMSNDFEATLRQISQARLVISSRLHGCIMSYSTGVPFIPIYCDDKTRAFTETHTRLEGYSPKQFEVLESTRKVILKGLDISDNQENLVQLGIENNIKLATQVKEQIFKSN